MKKNLSRRKFVKTSAHWLGALPATISAASYARILGANERIQLAFLGCGNRSRGHRNMVAMSRKEKNLDVVAVCDLWKHNREKAATACNTRFGVNVEQFKYSEDLLAMPDLDGVMIATGDHQHAKILAEVVRAGKDCYCEKPLAIDVADAKLARDAVMESDQVVQMGSQWVSDPMQHRVREIVRSGKLGQITKVVQCWNDNNHRWHDPDDSDVHAIREQDTDWRRWLLGRPDRPFDPWTYFEFRIFKDFSGGITSQWMSHGIGLVHFYTDTEIPDSMVASGGIFGWPDIRENPDTFQALATYEEKNILYSYSSSYANEFGDYSLIRGKDATLFAHGGEGSPRWFLIREHHGLAGGFDFFAGLDAAVKKGQAEMLTCEEYGNVLPPVRVSDDSKWHLDNWIDCMRARNKQTNGHILTGYWHSIGVVMATRAYREGKKLYYDREQDELVENAPCAAAGPRS